MFFSKGDLSILHLFNDLCSPLHMSIWIHEYVFGVLGHNSILCCCSTCFSFGYWEFFLLACVSLWHIPLTVGFFQHFLTFCHDKIQAHLIHFPSPVLDSGFLQGPLFPFLGELYWNQGVDSRYVLLLDVMFVGLLGWQSQEKCVCVLTWVYMHIYKYVYTLLSVYMAR